MRHGDIALLRPYSISNPPWRMQFGQDASAKLQRKCLSTTAFEDEGDDEDENEAHCEGGWFCHIIPGFDPGLGSFRPFGALQGLAIPRRCASSVCKRSGLGLPD
jgi:hypothetical protein